MGQVHGPFPISEALAQLCDSLVFVLQCVCHQDKEGKGSHLYNMVSKSLVLDLNLKERDAVHLALTIRFDKNSLACYLILLHFKNKSFVWKCETKIKVKKNSFFT